MKVLPPFVPPQEIALRHARSRHLLQTLVPEAGGLLIASRLGIYYLTGTMGWGLLWLPVEGNPVLMVRKGRERALLESPLSQVVSFKSYKEVPGLCADVGSPLSSIVAVDKNGFSWTMAEMLQSRLGGVCFVSGDAVLTQARAVKSEWELEWLRLCGSLHAHVLDEVLPANIRPGMTEREIALCYVHASFASGGNGQLRMTAHGEELFFGYTSAGDSGNYPTYYNGPLGCAGAHPATPFLGSEERRWKRGEPLSLDMGFSVAGYATDRTQIYWSGPSIPDDVRRAHDVCIRILEQAMAELKPGGLPASIYEGACALARQEGQEAGFMGLGADKVAFLGHGIGLAVDEFPAFARGFTAPLEKGMVVALEPKIGLPGIGMVGVEHTFEITGSGARSLTGERREILIVS